MRPLKESTIRWIGFGLAAGIPLGLYTATLSAHGYWLDGGELCAQAVSLDIAHPPGHPVAGLFGHLATLLPVGPLPMRVAFVQSLCAATAIGLLFIATESTLRSARVSDAWLRTGLALAGAWMVAGSYGWWFQAVRPEVYALQALLLMVAVERLVALETAWPSDDLRPLYTAGFALGLALANHHLVALLALPATAPTLARVVRARGLRPLLYTSALTLLGLSAYVYLPLRSLTDPAVNLGDPSTPAHFWWVVSARAYAHSMGFEATQPMGERFLDAMLILGRNLSPTGPTPEPMGLAIRALATVGTIAVGAYAMVRTPSTSRLGFFWGALFFVNVAARAWLGRVRDNPDILGYLMPGLAAAMVLIVSLIGLLLRRFSPDEGRPQTPRYLLLAVAASLVAFSVFQFRSQVQRASLTSFTATDAFDDERVRRLPYRAVVIAHDPQTVFRHWSLDATERARPDVTLIAVPFLGYPGFVEHLVARDPEVRPIIRGILLRGELHQPDMQSLATRRPLLVEMDPRVPESLYDSLLPRGLYYEVLAGGTTDTDVRNSIANHFTRLDRLDRLLGDEREQQETIDQLVWRDYMDALFFASAGMLDASRRSVERAGRLVDPPPNELELLRQALDQQPEDRPLDVGPFRLEPDAH